MSAFLLSYGFSSVLLSGLGDRIAPLRLLTGMMVVWCILMVIMGFTHNPSPDRSKKPGWTPTPVSFMKPAIS